MRLVMIKGRSQYGSLRLHVDQLAAALNGLGHDTAIIDLAEGGSLSPLVDALRIPTDCLFAFNGMACEIAVQQAIRDLNLVYASVYVDHPVPPLSRLTLPIERQALFFLDRSHVQFMAAWGARYDYAHVGFLPPGANVLDEPVDTSEAAFAARDIPLLFTGTYRGAPTPMWAEWPDSPAREIVAATGLKMAADARLPIMDALRAVMAERRAALSADLLASLGPLLVAAQQYAEAHQRHVVLTALGEAGAPITVYGNGWEALSARYPSIRHAGEGSFEETLRLLRRTRVVLNINNGFVAGGHERVFTAMSAGAAVFSESSRYYAEAFQSGVEAPAKLIALMADEPRQASIARAGHARAIAEHSWAARAAKIVSSVEAAR
jgi:hypothetical protein